MKKILFVLDSNGDTAVEFDEADAKTVAEARELFERMTRQRAAVFAVNRGEGVEDKKIKSFTELEAENVIVPAIQGG